MAYTKQTWQDSPNTTTPITAARLSHIEDGIEANSNAIEALGGGVAMFTAEYVYTWHTSGELETLDWVFRLTNGATPGKVRQALNNGQLPVLKYVIDNGSGNPFYVPTIKCAYFTHSGDDGAHFKTDTAEITIKWNSLGDEVLVTFTGTL